MTDFDEDLYEDLEDESVQVTNFSHNGAEVQIPVWKTKDGKFIKIPDMTDLHLTNTIKYLERKAVDRAIARNHQYYNILELATETYQAYDKNIYLSLVYEAIKRSIIVLESRITPHGTLEKWQKPPSPNQDEPPSPEEPKVRKIIL